MKLITTVADSGEVATQDRPQSVPEAPIAPQWIRLSERSTRSLQLAVLTIFLEVFRTQAQLVADGHTNAVSAIATNVTGNLVVGTNAPYTMLVISNTAVVTDMGQAYIGSNAPAKSNQVVVTGSGSRWRSMGKLTVGQEGSFNQLRILSGGSVSNGLCTIGAGLGGSNNLALVSGANSTWTNTGVTVGDAGSWNALIVSNGGRFVGTFSLGINALSHSNVAVLTGSGTRHSYADVSVGGSGVANRFVMTNGGVLISSNGYVGNFGSKNEAFISGPTTRWTNLLDFSVGMAGQDALVQVNNGAILTDRNAKLGDLRQGSNNIVWVDGANSLWATKENLVVGSDGTTNEVWVGNGGLVTASNLVVGAIFDSSNNAVWVEASGRFMVTNPNASVASSSDFRHGSLFMNGGYFESDFLNMATGPSSGLSFGWGTLVVGGGLINNSRPYVSVGETGPGTLEIRPRGLAPLNPLTVFGSFLLGSNGANCRLSVTNGGVLDVRSGSSFIGFNTNSRGNLALVSASTWTNQYDLVAGYDGGGNRLVISNAGLVVNASGWLGYNAGAGTNTAELSGPGSVWWNRTNLVVGYSGSRNSLLVGAGATLLSDAGAYLGYYALSSNNTAILNGTNSEWTSQSDLFVGNLGSGNLVAVSNSATVTSRHAYLGYGAGSNNAAVVSGPGSRWQNNGDLVVGVFGASNQLLVANGGLIEDGIGDIGGSSGNNLALVSGAGSLWTNRSSLFVGYDGPGNRLVVTGGGTVASAMGSVGFDAATSSSNSALVTGPNSVWKTAGDLVIGNLGAANRLVVSNGGTMQVGATNYVGYAAASTAASNVLVVTDAGSLCNQKTLHVGEYGLGNRLFVLNGGTLTATDAAVGYMNSAPPVSGAGNNALVSGPGSLWRTTGTLTLGASGPGNQLEVSDFGTVSASNFLQGANAAATLNSTLLSGGNLLATNAAGTARAEIRRGSLRLDSGYLDADNFTMTNAAGSQLVFNGGTIAARNGLLSLGTPVIVGNGSTSAALEVRGNGVLTFANGVQVSNNGWLKGNGTIVGNVVLNSGATLAPGASIGRLTVNSLALSAGATSFFEINKSAGTNDTLVVLSGLTFNGTLVVANQAGALAAGDSFKLFSAPSYSGSFSQVMPPTPGPGLRWDTNQLAADGILRVVSAPPPVINSSLIVGGNMVIAGSGGAPFEPFYLLSTTNLALPVTSWDRWSTNMFEASGGFSCTNTVDYALPQRFFLLQLLQQP